MTDAALAEELFAEARDDGLAVHPAVGVRIREQIEAKIARKRPGLVLPWAIAAVTTAGAIALVLSRDVERPVPPERREVAAAAEPPMVVRSVVRAREDAVSVELSPNVRANVAAGGAMIPLDPPEVLEGEVEFRVAKLPLGETYRVLAGRVTVEVIGTVFTVRRTGDRVEVGVSEGAVRVLEGELEHEVIAPERWSNEEVPKESRASHILQASLQTARKKAAPSTHGDLEPIGPAESEKPIRKPGNQESKSQEEDPFLDSWLPNKNLKHSSLDDASEHGDSKQSVQQRSLLERAAEHLKRGELDDARAIYRELTGQDESGAALGYYLLARLEARHARRPKQALEALDVFRDRFPEHPLAAEAAASRIEALLDLDRCDEARVALIDFRAHHAEASELIAGSSVRHSSDCRAIDERSPPSDH